MASLKIILILKTFSKKENTFSSDTDSEVISHLINWNFKKSNNMDSALIETANSLEGSYAIGIICSMIRVLFMLHVKVVH